MPLGPHPEFAWSVSRAELFEFCPRKYYHRYHGGWGGWRSDADERRQRTYLIGKRTSLPAWAGQEVHRAAAHYLLGRTPVDALLDEVRERMREQFRASRRRDFLQPGNAKAFGLLEHLYDEPLPDERVRGAWEHVEASLRALDATDYRAAVREAAEQGRRLHLENPERSDFEFMKLLDHGLGDFPVFANPDLVLQRADGRIAIVDWKTGTPPPPERRDRLTHQLAFYALWTRDRQGLSGDELRRLQAHEHYLPGGETTGGPVRPEDIEAALEFARDSVAELRGHLADPLQNRAEEADFPARGTPGKCRSCDFRGVCRERVG